MFQTEWACKNVQGLGCRVQKGFGGEILSEYMSYSISSGYSEFRQWLIWDSIKGFRVRDLWGVSLNAVYLLGGP